jgi:NitT/TauT family transport system permease protein
MHYKSNLLLPSPLKTGEALFSAVQDLYTLQNLLLTMKRLVIGLGIALGLGLTVGFTMGSSGAFLKLMDPIISTIRQVPIMAWVPLTIIWFGLGDGPTLFLIAMVGVFPIVLNTIAGVQSIPKNYFHAARSLGATPWGIFSRVTLPASLPGIMTGLRIALGAGWMSVICAEFIATSAGFGFSMVQAQTMMETPLLIALMIISAGVGYSTDIFIRNMEKKITKWRFVS